MTDLITSVDGTRIACSKIGKGAPVILVDGALCHRKFGGNEQLAKILAAQFTVHTYDRRGRGESTNTLPYAVEREYEDLQRVIEAAGQNAFVFGISSGAALVLEAARNGVKAKKLAVYEVPYMVDASRPPLPADYLETLQTFIDTGESSKAIHYFMTTGVGLPNLMVWLMRVMPAWKKMKKLAHTLVYDTLLLGENCNGKPLNPEYWQRLTLPVCVMAGTKSEKWARNSMQNLASVLPTAEFRALKRQTHLVNPNVLAVELTRFFQVDLNTSD